MGSYCLQASQQTIRQLPFGANALIQRSDSQTVRFKLSLLLYTFFDSDFVGKEL